MGMNTCLFSEIYSIKPSQMFAVTHMSQQMFIFTQYLDEDMVSWTDYSDITFIYGTAFRFGIAALPQTRRMPRSAPRYRRVLNSGDPSMRAGFPPGRKGQARKPF